MTSKVLSRRDLDFLLFEWLQSECLTSRDRFKHHSRETFDAALELSQQLAERHFATHNAKSDREEPRFDGERVTIIPEVAAALTAFNKSGLFSGAMDEALGGFQLPNVIHRACFAWFQAANIATASYPMLTMANANLLITHGSPAQIDTFVAPMVEGRYFGTMCLSEPQAGSSLADVTTRAVPAGDGTFRLYGNKMWISGGDHELSENIVHLVLARVEGSPRGVKGLSLFIVPKFLVNEDGSLGERNDVVLAGLNHKMGYRGTTNAVLNFGEGTHTPRGSSGAVGYLLGEQNHGLDYMFHMMNEARIGVGAGATCLGYTGYLHALDYARSRLQGRVVGAKDPATPQVPIVQHADVRRMLLASKAYVEGAMALVLYAARLLDEQQTASAPAARDRAGLLLDVLTPIVKSWPSQWCLVANDHAIQIHGGYGYTREYPVEQFYRDNRLNPIHEGTHGIQAQDLLGRKIVMRDGAGLQLLVQAISETVGEATGDLAAMGAQLQHAVTRVVRVTESLWATGDPATALANAAAYLEVVGHTVIAWMWLEQAIVAMGKEGDFYAGKRAAASYFFTHELPRIEPQLDLLASMDVSLLAVSEAWL
ncbi:acyl-CoA dehydrogenase [Planosporangium sp. 12N6]|uniref:acyl-CoA dehydrogenase n=1 Tax=Planosporangium spinosum TaxID=3402278 RepID=UPI003CE859FB